MLNPGRVTRNTHYEVTMISAGPDVEPTVAGTFIRMISSLPASAVFRGIRPDELCTNGYVLRFEVIEPLGDEPKGGK